MARFKQKDSQLSKTGDLQARTVAIIPIHRSSVVQPRHVPILPHDSRRLSATLVSEMSAAGIPNKIPSRVDVYRPQSRTQLVSSRQQRRSSAAYPKFMNKFCVEPPNDVNTCCIGFWVPCALYGKIAWRLNEYERNRDGSDEAWHPKYGCNQMCCGLASAICLLPHIVTGTLVGCQRAQVRGTYGIDGHIAADVCAGIWCTPCVLMQSDREVRAREGVMRLRNNMPVSGIVKSQPKHKESMRYEAPQEGETENSRLDPSQSREPEMKKLQKLEPRPWIEAAYHQDHNVQNFREYGRTPDRKYDTKDNTKHDKTESYRPFPSDKGKPLKSALRNKQETPIVIITQFQDEPQQGHDVELSTFPKREKTKGQKGLVDRAEDEAKKLAKKAHDLIDRKTSGNQKQKGDQLPHQLSDCDILVAVSDYGGKEHSLEDCEVSNSNHDDISRSTASETAPTKSPLATTPMQEHRLSNCETVPASEEMSYVHDFAGCPVDKAVLDYVEEQNKKANDHEFQNCTRASSVRTDLTISEHALAQCTPSSKPSSTSTQSSQHRRATYASGVSKTRKGHELKEHRLASCPIPPLEDNTTSMSSNEDALHRLSTCATEPCDNRGSGEHSEGTQRTVVNTDKGKERADENNPGLASPKVARSIASGGKTSGSDSPGDDTKPRSRQRRRRNGSRKPKQLDGNANNPEVEEHRPVFIAHRDSAQVTLERVLAAQKDKKETNA